MKINHQNDIGSIRKLASQYTYDQLDNCISHQLNAGRNACLADGNSDRTISLLAKASFIKKLTEEGYSLNNAIRELGSRMRVFN